MKGEPAEALVNEVVLRAQSQAEYTHENYGHFGLNLRRYAHFTSPIRRYADLIVHRALIRALGLGAGGLDETSAKALADIAERISAAERRAMAAERETMDRLIAAHMADQIGARFVARIAGVTQRRPVRPTARHRRRRLHSRRQPRRRLFPLRRSEPRAGRHAHRRDFPPRRHGRSETGRGRAVRRRAAFRDAVRGRQARPAPARRNAADDRDQSSPRRRERPLGPRAVRRGFAGRCPHCGEGRLFRAYLKVDDACPVCGEDFTPQRADDAPAYVTILIVGHFIVAGVVAAEDIWPNSPVLVAAFVWAARRRWLQPGAAAAGQGRADRLPMGGAHARLRRPGARARVSAPAASRRRRGRATRRR